jgi:peptidoglycan/LPS O-acetylase OafA/YrhL
MRLKRIDVFRLLAIYLVIWAHSQFFDGIKAETLPAKGIELGAVLALRSTMQFFFIVSGYFVGGKIIEQSEHRFATAWKYSKKLLLAFVVWCAIYAVWNAVYLLRSAPLSKYALYFINLATKNPVNLIFEGTRIHLWFLMSLFLTIWLFALWPLDKKGKSFLAFGALLFAIGLLGGSYQITPIGIHLEFNTRDGIFFSTLFFAIGVLVYLHKPQVSPALAWGLYLGGFALFSLETYFLWANWSALPIRHDFLISSIPYGVGAFFIAFTAKRETKLDTLLAPYGKYVLGIYASHLIFLDMWKPLGDAMNPILWAFLLPVLVFTTALMAVILISKTPLKSIVV